MVDDDLELGLEEEGDARLPIHSSASSLRPFENADESLEFDLIEARGDELPWDSPLREVPGRATSVAPAGTPSHRVSPLPGGPATGSTDRASPTPGGQLAGPAARVVSSSIPPEGIPELPDLEVRPSRPPGAAASSAAQAAGSSRPPRVELELASTAQVPAARQVPGAAHGAASTRGPTSAPPTAPGARARAATQQSARPGAMPSLEPSAPSRARGSQRPGATVGLGPGGGGLDGGVSSWDWDDGLGDAASAQLNVVAEVAEEDVPWPHCRTPEPDQFSIDRLEAKRIGALGEAPDGFLGAPLYFLRARGALATLEGKRKAAAEALVGEEERRDRLLADLALSLRAELAKNERLAALFREAERSEAAIAERKQAFAAADREGAQRMQGATEQVAQTELQLSALSQELSVRRSEEENQQREVRRLEVQAKRLEIERRNVAQRARGLVPVGEDMPPELAVLYVELGARRETMEPVLRVATERLAQAAARRKAAQDAERRARSDLSKVLATRQSLTVAQQGMSRAYAESLEEAERERRQGLADAGRGIVALRGEVRVDVETRRALLEADSTVKEAARALEVCVQARMNLDTERYDQGKSILLGLALLLVAAFVLLVVF